MNVFRLERITAPVDYGGCGGHAFEGVDRALGTARVLLELEAAEWRRRRLDQALTRADLYTLGLINTRLFPDLVQIQKHPGLSTELSPPIRRLVEMIGYLIRLKHEIRCLLRRLFGADSGRVVFLLEEPWFRIHGVHPPRPVAEAIPACF